VSVTIDVPSARTNVPFVTDILKSPDVLHAKAHPKATFRSTRITGSGNNAKIDGMLTLKGITKPATLNAKLFRPKGTAANDKSNLIFKITGQIDRRAFNADAYAKEVGPKIDLNITAYVKAR